MAWPSSCILISFFTLILLHSSSIAAQKGGKLTVDQSLTATTGNGSSLLSPSGDFAFGFHQFPNSSNLFLLAIWYAKIRSTIVWHANDGIPVSQGSSIKITADKGLVLSDPKGIDLWNTSADVIDGGEISYGFLYDTGNFVLKRNSNNTVWQSFDHPTDTLLPSQQLLMDVEVNSRLSKTNFTKGRFQLRLIPDGNLVLNTRDLTTGFAYGAYYTSGTNENPEISGNRLVYNESGYMFILRKNESRQDILPPYKVDSAKDNYQRATLSFDGVLTWYSVPKTSISEGWLVRHAIPENICMQNQHPAPDLGSGICGFNSICTLGDDGRPTCTCPPSYSRDFDDIYGSCKPNFTDACEGYAERAAKGEYSLVRLPTTDWPFNDYERLNPSTQEECKNSCLNDCFCAAAIFQDDENRGCWKKKAPLSNGRKDTTVQGTTWIKVANVTNPNDPINPLIPIPPSKEKHRVKFLTKVLLGVFTSFNLLVLSAIGLGIFIYHKRKLKVFNKALTQPVKEYSNVHCFSYQELYEATNGFKEELGRGAFGVVYKGMVSGGGPPICVAVKKLDRISGDTDKEFKTEVNVIGQTHHKNLVQLVGFCKEDEQRLLVYEYMSNGSLADHLFNNLRLSWNDRVNIAQGLARGLLYLHEECSTQIIHCDIKPQNILLDDHQNARISDFGLAKLLALNQTHTNTGIRGTKGYVAPEWFRHKPVTVKVDVYSFGVLLLEIICCRKSVCMELVEEEEEAAILTDWAFDCYLSNRLDVLVNDDMEALKDIIRLKRFVMVALWCIQEDPNLRPTMRTVTQMLDGLVEVPKNPPPPTSFSNKLSE